MRRFLAFAALLGAFLVLAAGCGGSDSSTTTSASGNTTTGSGSETVPTEEWAGSVCTSIATWTDSLTASVSKLQGSNVSPDTVKEVAAAGKSSTATLVSDLKGLGKPDTEAGAKAQDTLDQLAADLQKNVAKLTAVGKSGTLVISTVRNTIISMGNQLANAFTDLQKLDAKGELEDAFKSADSCDQLTS